MSQLDQHPPHRGGARPDEPRVGLPDAARGVAGRDATEPGQLLARVEAGEAPHLGPQRDGGNQPDPLERHEPGDERIVRHGDLGCASEASIWSPRRESFEMVLDKPAVDAESTASRRSQRTTPLSRRVSLRIETILPQQPTDAELDVGAAPDELAAMTDQSVPLANRLRCQPDPRQVVNRIRSASSRASPNRSYRATVSCG